MMRLLRLCALGCAALLTLVACTAEPSGEGADTQAPSPPTTPAAGEPLTVVTSFTILEDMVRAIGGDLVEVHNLVPTGTDPHEYEPLPDDIRATADADLLLYNGLNLEGGEGGWFSRLTDAASQPEAGIVEVSEHITPRYLGEGEADEQVNPHAFIDPGVGAEMARVIARALQDADPEHAETYRERGEAYIADIEAIEAEYAERLGAIPDQERVLVTSERAFQYLAAEYGITELYIWEIDTDENGSAQQIIALVEALRDQPVRYLVMESNKDPRPMQMVSEEVDIPMFERPIYSDEIGGSEGGQASTYLDYLSHNLDVLAEALGAR